MRLFILSLLASVSVIQSAEIPPAVLAAWRDEFGPAKINLVGMATCNGVTYYELVADHMEGAYAKFPDGIAKRINGSAFACTPSVYLKNNPEAWRALNADFINRRVQKEGRAIVKKLLDKYPAHLHGTAESYIAAGFKIPATTLSYRDVVGDQIEGKAGAIFGAH